MVFTGPGPLRRAGVVAGRGPAAAAVARRRPVAVPAPARRRAADRGREHRRPVRPRPAAPRVPARRAVVLLSAPCGAPRPRRGAVADHRRDLRRPRAAYPLHAMDPPAARRRPRRVRRRGPPRLGAGDRRASVARRAGPRHARCRSGSVVSGPLALERVADNARQPARAFATTREWLHRSSSARAPRRVSAGSRAGPSHAPTPPATRSPRASCAWRLVARHAGRRTRQRTRVSLAFSCTRAPSRPRRSCVARRTPAWPAGARTRSRATGWAWRCGSESPPPVLRTARRQAGRARRRAPWRSATHRLDRLPATRGPARRGAADHPRPRPHALGRRPPQARPARRRRPAPGRLRRQDSDRRPPFAGVGLMDRRLVAGVLVAGLASLVAGAATGSRAADDPEPDGISVSQPDGWHRIAPPLTSVTFPVDRLLLTTYPAAGGGNCGPDRAARALPAGGALVYLIEYRPRVGDTWRGLRRRDFPPRPEHFTLRRRALANYECWRVPSYLIRFRDADRPFQLHVALGPRATPARRAQVLRVLDSLRFEPLPRAAARPVRRLGLDKRGARRQHARPAGVERRHDDLAAPLRPAALAALREQPSAREPAAAGQAHAAPAPSRTSPRASSQPAASCSGCARSAKAPPRPRRRRQLGRGLPGGRSRARPALGARRRARAREPLLALGRQRPGRERRRSRSSRARRPRRSPSPRAASATGPAAAPA